MALSCGQYYSVSMREEEYIIQLSFILQPGEHHSAEQCIELLDYFEHKLVEVMDDFMKDSCKPIAHIPCHYCSEPHLELQLLLKREPQHCTVVQKPIPKDYYCDLITNKGIFIIL